MQDTATDSARHRKAVTRLILATAAWGISFPLFKMLFAVQQGHEPSADSFFLAAHAIGLRALGAALVISLFKPFLLRGLSRAEWLQGALLGLFGGTGLILQADGLHYTSASTSAFLTQFYCVLLPAWQCFRRREIPSPRLLLCTALVLAGITILSGFDWNQFRLGRGETETLLSAVVFTVQIQLLERPSWRNHRMLPVSVVMFLGFFLCALPVVLLKKPSWHAITSIYQSAPEIAIMAAIILICTVYAYTAMNHWQPFVRATEAGLIYCLEPVTTALYVLFLPALLAAWTGVPYANESLGTATLIGGTLITLANAILQLPQKKSLT
jgi:drug/metabolite transporter (DMT)-like permease